MAWINSDLVKYISETFPDRKVQAYHDYYTWQSSRYISVTTILKDDFDIHYEYRLDNNRYVVELHLEGKYQHIDYRSFVKELRINTSRNTELKWLNWQNRSQCRCQFTATIDSWSDLVNAFKKIMQFFDPLIESAEKQAIQQSVEPYSGRKDFFENGLGQDSVCLETCSLGQLFSNPLVIPDYQRNYCWEDKQVKALWNSLKEIPQNSNYHLGTIILQKDKEGKYNIIDGQQRLVTLTLIVQEMKYSGELPLLTQSFRSENSRKHIANSKWLIKQLASKTHDQAFCKRIIENLNFSVLILTDSRLDLAYTFFSNENSKGVPLSDYDLLKAHHLRFILNGKQAEHLAGRWNSLIEKEYRSLEITLATHLFRLRRWMRKNDYDPEEKLRVKEEFSAAILIPEIPPFGEKFDFYEKIQGGTHFFVYAEFFVEKYRHFITLKQYKSLRYHLQWESHWRYADVIETLLFAYYLKFGTHYFTEALFCISANIAQHRYSSERALSYKIREFAKDSEIVMMINQASSPTFFLAECLSAIRKSGKDIEELGIKFRFYQRLQDLFAELLEDLTDETIKEKYDNEYL